MEEHKDFLPYFITEEVYAINDGKEQPLAAKDEDAPAEVQEKQEVIAASAAATGQKSDDQERFNFEQETAIVIDRELGESELELLKKILGAVQTNLDQVQFVQKADFYKLSEIEFTKVILFSDQTDNNLYQILNYKGAEMIKADSLQKIAADQQKKKLLWESLKSLFGL